MKQDRMTVPTFLIAAMLAALVSFSGTMCLADAYSMDCSRTVLLACCCTAAVLAAASMWPRRSWPLALAAAVLYLAVLVWQREPMENSLQAVLFRISGEWALCFENVQIIGQEGGDPLWILAALAVPLAWLTAWVSSREGSAILVLLACMPVLLLSLIIVDIAPVLWLILLTGALMLLVISHSVRERSPAEGSRLAWWLVLPTIILVSGITVLWPPADYVRADWSETLQTMAEARVNLKKWQEQTFSSYPKWNRELQKVDLSEVGPKVLTGVHVLDYRADAEVAYLRGVSLGIYGDNSWTAIDSAAYYAQGIESSPLVAATDGSATLEIRTESREPLLYTTYYLAALPEQGKTVDDAYLQNSHRQSAYTISFEPPLRYLVRQTDAYEQFVYSQYLQIPEQLQEALREIAKGAGLMGAPAETVVDYVRTSGIYDLNTPAVPAGEDFVLYFLQQSRQGYCVHFASAAVMLLRTVGIPARYVTGYAVSGETNQWNPVTQDDAHAWVEYYVDGLGWRPLDPTPADRTEVPEPEPEPEEQTEPQDLPAPSEPAPSPDQPEQTPAKQPEQQAGQTAGTAPQGGKTNLHLSPKLLWLLALPGLAALLWLRRWLGLRYRRERCTKGHPNRRVLTYWRWLTHLSRAAEMPPEEELLALAEKARFSQHTMNDQELEQMRLAVDRRVAALKTAPKRKRLWYKYGLVLY